jgi:hypothetical protein
MYQVYVSPSLKYGYDKRYALKSEATAELFKTALRCAYEIMKLPPDLKIALRPLPRKTLNGYYTHRLKKVVIDPRKGELLTLLQTLAHELVHAEQFHDGRFAITPRSYQWCGKDVKLESRNYLKYISQPWEAEAFRRQNGIAQELVDLIAEEMKV